MTQSLQLFTPATWSPNLSLPRHSFPKSSASASSFRFPFTLTRFPIRACSSSDLDPLPSSSSSPVLVSDNGTSGGAGIVSSGSRDYVPIVSDASSIEVDAVTEAELKENGFRSTRRTKLVCTIGPATCGFEQLEALAVGGMNVARINMCHGTREWHRSVIERVRRLNEEKGYAVAIMMDTEGSEIHMGDLGGASSAKAEVLSGYYQTGILELLIQKSERRLDFNFLLPETLKYAHFHIFIILKLDYASSHFHIFIILKLDYASSRQQL